MHGKSADTAVRSGGRPATKEQLRIAQVTQDGVDEDRSRIQKLIKEIVETTRCTLAVAELALHDASNNVELAVNNILESDGLDTWTYNRKGTKKEEPREEPVKKGGNRGPRRGNQNQREQKGGARANENGAEGRENRQPRNKEDGEFRGKRDQQPRNRREPGAKRDGKKSNAVETKTESDDHWKNGPLVFNRRENIEDEKETQQVNDPISKIISKPSNAPLSFADVVRRNAQKPQPLPQQPVASEPQHTLQVLNDAKQTSPNPHNLSNADGLQADENAFGLPETSKSPRQLGHHLDVESATSGLLQDEPTPVTFGAQPSPQKMHQSLTEQLKTDLGLGASNSTSFGTSPPKKFHEPLHQNKAVKSGVVEFLSGDAPGASSGDWQFGFDAAPVAPQNTVNDEHSQFRRDNVSKVSEPTRNEIGLPSSNITESSAPRGNASTVLNQYQQQSSQYGGSNSHQQQPFNNNRSNRNGVNNLPFSNNYSDNFNDLRSYGAPSSPPKTQPIQQPLQNLASQQQAHHHQQPIFPAYPSYPYMNMYSPVGPGLRDDFAPMLPFQYQSGLDALMMIPQLNATSAGQLPNHQSQHHQNPPQQNVQQGLQHNQSSHSLQNQQQNHQRSEHFSDMKFLANQNMSIPPSSQNNGANGHNSQQNSNLGNSQQQRQQLLDNSQNSVAPPPGFPFFAARNSFQIQNLPAFTQQFPYVMPNAQHKSK